MTMRNLEVDQRSRGGRKVMEQQNEDDTDKEEERKGLLPI